MAQQQQQGKTLSFPSASHSGGRVKIALPETVGGINTKVLSAALGERVTEISVKAGYKDGEMTKTVIVTTDPHQQWHFDGSINPEKLPKMFQPKPMEDA